MFHKEFFPTPIGVLEQMGIDCLNKVVLEPSAGKGDIVDYCKQWGAKEVLACEVVPDLQRILHHKCQIIAGDFFHLKSDQISHVQMIVMNPPFSNADKHILHAWNIAPEGCEIIALCNWATLENTRGWSRSELSKLVSDYGEGVNMGDCFSSAERKTNVEVGLVRLFKPLISDNEMLDDFYLSSDEEREDNSIIGYSEIKAIVNTYTSAVRVFDKVESAAKELAVFTNVTFIGSQLEDGSYEKHDLSFGNGVQFRAGYQDSDGIFTKEQFAKAFQSKCWSFIFNRVNIGKYVTRGVMEDINTFVNSRKNYPFTVRNIGKMLDIIIGTRSDIMNRAITEAVDNFTRHTHENRYGVEGWKTNCGHLLNKKFIIDCVTESRYGFSINFGGYRMDYLDDLNKSLCFLTGVDYSTINSLYRSIQNPMPGVWYDWGFFEVKLFKKGTGHFKFKDENVWATLNRAYAKIKGQVLPEKL